jgi:hypothetical protein
VGYHVLEATVVAGCGVIERSSRHSNRVMRAEDDHFPLPGERIVWSEMPRTTAKCLVADYLS